VRNNGTCIHCRDACHNTENLNRVASSLVSEPNIPDQANASLNPRTTLTELKAIMDLVFHSGDPDLIGLA